MDSENWDDDSDEYGDSFDECKPTYLTTNSLSAKDVSQETQTPEIIKKLFAQTLSSSNKVGEKNTVSEDEHPAESEERGSRKIPLLAQMLKRGDSSKEEMNLILTCLATLVVEDSAIESLIQCSAIGQIVDTLEKNAEVWKSGYHLLIAISSSKAGLRDQNFKVVAVPYVLKFLADKLGEPDGEKARTEQIEAALMFLQNSTIDFDMAEIVVNSGLNQVHQCLKVSEGSISGMACTTLTHCAHHARFRKKLVETGTVEKVIEFCSRIALKSGDSDDSRSFLRNGIRCLSSLCTSCTEGRFRTKDANGMALMALLKNSKLWDYLKDSCLALVKALFSGALESSEWAEEMSKWNGPRETKRNQSSYFMNANIIAKQERGNTLLLYNDERMKQDLVLPKTDEMEPKKMDQRGLPKMSLEAKGYLERMAVLPIQGKFYIKEELWSRPEDDRWVELSELTDLAEPKNGYVQRRVCAALNSRLKLSLYFGIINGRVKGMTVEKESRDEFRVGIDCAMTRGFEPTVDPNLYSVNFIPVLVKTGKESLQIQPDCFVVEIEIRHIATQFYRLVGEQVWMRQDNALKAVSFQDARKNFTLEFEKKAPKKQAAIEGERPIPIQVAPAKPAVEQKK